MTLFLSMMLMSPTCPSLGYGHRVTKRSASTVHHLNTLPLFCFFVHHVQVASPLLWKSLVSTCVSQVRVPVPAFLFESFGLAHLTIILPQHTINVFCLYCPPLNKKLLSFFSLLMYNFWDSFPTFLSLANPGWKKVCSSSWWTSIFSLISPQINTLPNYWTWSVRDNSNSSTQSHPQLGFALSSWPYSPAYICGQHTDLQPLPYCQPTFPIQTSETASVCQVEDPGCHQPKCLQSRCAVQSTTLAQHSTLDNHAPVKCHRISNQLPCPWRATVTTTLFFQALNLSTASGTRLFYGSHPIVNHSQTVSVNGLYLPFTIPLSFVMQREWRRAER